MSNIFYKTHDGFVDDGSILSCIYHYDKEGKYIGQEQLNSLGEADEPPTLFLSAQIGNTVPNMTAEEMENALLSDEE